MLPYRSLKALEALKRHSRQSLRMDHSFRIYARHLCARNLALVFAPQGIAQRDTG